jgi:hypothetical protein
MQLEKVNSLNELKLEQLYMEEADEQYDIVQ